MSRNLEDVFILIRISDVRGDPEVALFVDPWQMHADGSLLLAADCRYMALFETRPSFITLLAPGILPSSGENKSTKRLPKLFARKEVAQTQVETPAESFYTYNTLKIQEIRLLQLDPGQGDAPVKGTVQHVPSIKLLSFGRFPMPGVPPSSLISSRLQKAQYHSPDHCILH
jgi:hypothetical protein